LYSTYNRNIKKYNFYTCNKCSNIKNKKTNLEKYGVEHPLQSKVIHDKVINTCLKKYNVENTFQSKDKKIKIKLKYGVDNPMKNNEIKLRTKDTCIVRYGVEYSLYEFF